MRCAVVFAGLFFWLFASHAQLDSSRIDSLAYRIILIGDAGKQVNNVHPELELAKRLFTFDKKTTVIYLGDNVYPQGLPSIYANNYSEKKQILDSQINLVRGTEAKAFFIAGNHDWMQGRSGGWQQVINQYRYVMGQQLDNVQYIPYDVCPGPEEIELSDNITLVAIDSQWWLHKFNKPSETTGCDVHREDEFLAKLKDIVNRNEDKLLIFASHHPFITYGRHGGFYNLKQHIFPFTELNPKLYIPLPILGSLYPLARGVFGNIQDNRHPLYRIFSGAVDSVLSLHPYCIRVAGHEHNLQLIERNKQHYVVSGAGSKISEVSHGPDLKFAAPQTGFAVLDVVKNGHVWVNFYSSMADSSERPIHTSALPSLDTTRIIPRLFAPIAFVDSVTVEGAPYYKAGPFKEWLLGENYRDEWTQPIRVKVFDVGKEKGGLKPTRRGGGMQTKSLRLEDSTGTEYVLRSIEKFPDNTLPVEFRQTFIRDAVVDGISASYPYAALSIPKLSRAAKVPYAQPKLVFVPDDPRFGYYQTDFANTLAIFEEREPEVYGNNFSTDKLIERLEDDNDDRVAQEALLKARLLDMFIMDFDRHEDQWRWGTIDTGVGKTFFPIPRDRDQAFFVSDGLVPSFVRKPWIFPKFQGFRAKAININTFNFNARHFDRMFLNELNEEQWSRQADTLIMQMTDAVIEQAIRDQPPEIFQYSGPEIIQKLKERRKYLKREALQYYHFLAREVNIAGSNKREMFLAERAEDGSVDVTVFKLNNKGERGRPIYHRKFEYDETDEIRWYGKGGEDSFVVKGNVDRAIQIRIIGGSDKDVINNLSKARKRKTVVYDFVPEDNVLMGEPVRNELSYDIAVNRWDNKGFRYNELIPKMSVAYNIDDGLFIGAGVQYIGHAFRKEPYAIMHEFMAQHALSTKAYNFRYGFQAIDVLGRSDLVIDAIVRSPRYTLNYFGKGNNSVYDRSNGKNITFYRTRFDQAEVAVSARSQLTADISVKYGPVFQYFSVDSTDNKGRIITSPGVSGIDPATLFQTKTYLGAQALFLIDNRNTDILPSRGVHWQTLIRLNKGLNDHTNNFSHLNSDMSIFISSRMPPTLVVGLRFGAGVNFGNYEYFQSQFLGGTENLRGYRKNRFAGDRMLYNNIDVRLKLKEFQTYLFPGSLGIVVFHDIGRVWVKGEQSARWHNGYGAGIWLSPASRFVLTLNYTRSKEGSLPLVSVGFQF